MVLAAPPVAPAAVAVVVVVVPAVMGESGGRRGDEQGTPEKNRAKDSPHQSIPF
jgi:hypothetical protein